MSKKKHLKENISESKSAEEEVVVASEDAGDTTLPAKEEKNSEKALKNDKAKDVKQNKNAKKKEKKPKEKKLARKAKETVSELKKVTWPGFGEVCKKTGVVLAVVLIFALVLFGLDTLFGYLFGLLT